MTSATYDAAYLGAHLDEILARKPLFLPVYVIGPYAVTRSLCDRILAAGVGLMANAEKTTDWLRGGRPAGVQIASEAMTSMRALGWAMDGTEGCLYSVDVDAPLTDFPRYDAGFDGINATHAGHLLSGCYGEGALIDHLVAGKRIALDGWLSASQSFPGWNPADPHVGLVQQVGTDIPGTDRDIITDPTNLGIRWPSGHPYAQGAPDMPLTAADEALISQALQTTNFGIPQPDGTWVSTPLSTIIPELFNGVVQLINGQNAQAQSLKDTSAGTAAIVAALPTLLSAISQIDPSHPDPQLVADIHTVASTIAAIHGAKA